MKFKYGPLATTVVIVGLLFLGILLLTSGGPKKPTTPENTPKPLIDYASTDATVSLTTKGAINGQEIHREIRITVGRDFRALEVIKGYNNSVIKEKTFSNSRAAFSEFLYALSYANFTRKRDFDIKTEQGACALGNRYVFILEKGGRDISRLWTSTCSGTGKGTFGGNTPTLLALFEKQIPNYDELTHRIRLQ